MTIGQKIKIQREAQKMTQDELGRACGTTKQTIFKYETGVITNIPMDRLCVIAEKLRVNPCWLLGWEDTSALKAKDLTENEISLLSDFRLLSEDGQIKLLDYASDLVASGRYKKATRSDFPGSMAKEA